MNYELFPVINNINDVLRHIEGAEEFQVVERLGGYKVINYVKLTSDTFRPLYQESPKLTPDYKGKKFYNLEAAIRRECRGIVFRPDGSIARRPYNKFFNVGEREETLIENIDFTKPHIIMEKLDGSLISPIILEDGSIYWGTKMLAADFHQMVLEFLDKDFQRKVRYGSFVAALDAQGLTSMFEFCSRQNRIVVDHPIDRLVLTGIRHNVTGEYVDWQSCVEAAAQYGIEVANVWNSDIDDLQELVYQVRDIVDQEGIVLRFENGEMHKVKGDQYVAIHKTKDDLLYERNVITLIFDEKIDDIIPYLIDTDKERIEEYINNLNTWLFTTIKELSAITFGQNHLSRKDWAVKYSSQWYSSIVFKNWELYTAEDTDIKTWTINFAEGVENLIRNACIANNKLVEFKERANMRFYW